MEHLMGQYNIKSCQTEVIQKSNNDSLIVVVIENSKRVRTWLPKTPIAQAEETCSGPNQTAATLGGTPRMNTCDTANTDCPMRAT